LKLKMKSKVLFLTASVIFILILALVFGRFDFLQRKAGKIESVASNVAVPPFNLLNLKGEKVRSADFQGKVILLNFWASWCPPCREEIPFFNELYNRYKKEGLVVIGIALDRGGPEEVQKFVDKFKVEFIILRGDEAVVEAFNSLPGMGPFQGVPTTFLIDRQGQICRRFVGFTEKAVVEEAIQQVFSKKT
jgi:cytochrome c biogenesis protein CcmG/thiol:disulfide interchange protein DsbE